MYCKNCGKQIPDNVMFCPSCDAKVEQSRGSTPIPSPLYQPQYQSQNQQQNHPEQSYPVIQGKPSVGFLDAIKLFFTNYVNFSGRSRRSEYWYATLFNIIVSTLLTSMLPDIAGLWSLAILIPGIALCVRRLHDIGKSGWWYLLVCIPLVGQIIMIVWFCQDSDPDNQWGPNPKY